MKQRFLAIILALSLCLSLLPTAAFAAGLTVTITEQILAQGRLEATVTGESAESEISYQWYEDGDSIEGATKAYLNTFDVEGNPVITAPHAYTVSVTVGEETVTSDPYKATYYTELQNGSFEKPSVNSGIGSWEGWMQYKSESTDYPELIWRTTGLGKDAAKPKPNKDIELVNPTLETSMFGPLKTSPHHNALSAPDGVQCAEVNAEVWGALYQDVLTYPGETLYWSFSHRGRNGPDTLALVIDSADRTIVGNNMDGVPKENIVAQVTDGNGIIDKNGNLIEDYEADRDGIVDGTDIWSTYSGTYIVPEGQYLTRFYFVAVEATGGDTQGNLIDVVAFSRTDPSIADLETWTIEYYVNGNLQASESGSASVGATVYPTKLNDYSDYTADANNAESKTIVEGTNVLRLDFTSPVPTTADYTVNYYKDAVDQANSLGTYTVEDVSVGTEIILEDSDEPGGLNWKKPVGYYAGVQQGGAYTIVEGTNVINVVYEKDRAQQHSVSAQVMYYFGDTLEAAKAKDVADATDAVTTASSWIGEDTTVTVAPNTTDKFVGYTYNSCEGALTYTMTAGATTDSTTHVVKVYYVKDESKTKTLTYTVQHIVGGEVKATETVSREVWENAADVLAIEDITLKTYTGYKYESNDQTLAQTADKSGLEGTGMIADGGVIKVTYVKDDSQVKELSYTIHYYKDDVLTDSETVKDTVWVNDTTLPVDDSKVNTSDKYEGYILEKVVPDVIPEVIEDEGVINVYYTKDVWMDADTTSDTEDRDNTTDGDGIPDKYQAVVQFQSKDDSKGTVSGDGTVQVFTFGEKEPYAASGTVDPDMSKVSAAAKSGYKFSIWTQNEETTGVDPDKEIKDVAGGTTIQFFANWARRSSGGSVPVPEKPPALNTEDHFAYIIGYPDGTVKPAGNITRAEVATIFFRLLTDEARNQCWSTENQYSDVAQGQWFNNAISTLSNAGIINGYSDGTFRPNAPITRAEFSKIAVSFFAYAGESYQGVFSDVPAGKWYAQFVEAANQLGLVTGYPDGTFLPEKQITRAEACTIVNRTIERNPHEDQLHEDMIVWADNPAPGEAGHAWYYEQVQEATNSHGYEDKVQSESWTEILENRNWAALEQAWANSNDAPGGEVVK